MFDFTAIPELRLSKGVHANAAEGVCFMEAISWFEGLPHSDHPECACPVLTEYGIRLNDRMPDDARNEYLRPLIPLVAGTRDPANERKRGEFLAMWAVNKVLPVVLRERGFTGHAEACEQARTLVEARAAAANAAYAATAYAAADAAAYATAYAAADAAADAAAYATAYAATAYAATAYATAYAADAAKIWQLAVEGLRQAVLIGRHDGFSHMADLEARAEAYRELAA